MTGQPPCPTGSRCEWTSTYVPNAEFVGSQPAEIIPDVPPTIVPPNYTPCDDYLELANDQNPSFNVATYDGVAQACNFYQVSDLSRTRPSTNSSVTLGTVCVLNQSATADVLCGAGHGACPAGSYCCKVNAGARVGVCIRNGGPCGPPGQK